MSLEIQPNTPVGEQTNLFGPPTKEWPTHWRAQGDQLRDFRFVQLSLSLMRAAELLGLEPRTLARLEAGEFTFDLEKAKQMLRAAHK